MSPAAPTLSKNPLAQSLLQMAGQSNVITVRKPFVEFTGSLEAAMLLDQLLYWSSRSTMGGWIAKSDVEFQEELCLKRYSVRAARDRLIEMGIVETDLRKFNGFPTQHYRLDMDRLQLLWIAFIIRLSEIEQTDYPKTDTPLSENGQSLTETTAETTKATTTAPSAIFALYENEIGTLTPLIADAIQAAEQDYPADWLPAAIHEAALNNKRNWKYCEAILKRWKVEGFQAARQPALGQQTARPKTTTHEEPKGFDAIRKFRAKHEASNG